MNTLDFDEKRFDGPSLDEEQVLLPTFNEVRQAGVRRRRNRRIGAVGVIAAAIALAVPGTIMLTEGNDTKVEKAAPATAFQQPSTLDSFAQQSATEWYAVLKSLGKDGKVTYTFAYTSDAGHTWKASKLPKNVTHDMEDVVESKKCGTPQAKKEFCGQPVEHLYGFGTAPVPLGPRTVAIRDQISHDAGQTWKPIPLDKVTLPTIASAPVGWHLMVLDRKPLIAVDPATGRWHRLAQQPPFEPTPARGDFVSPAADGSYWLHNENSKDGPSRVMVSHDRGKTWTTATIPGSGNLTMASRDGKTGYAILSDRDTGKSAVSVTTDGGRTWTDPRPVTGLGVTDALEVAADGSLLSTNLVTNRQPAPMVSHDGGRTFGRVPELPSGVYALYSQGPDSYTYQLTQDGKSAVSADGITFTMAPLPPNTW
jgi:hypothetical protein